MGHKTQPTIKQFQNRLWSKFKTIFRTGRFIFVYFNFVYENIEIHQLTDLLNAETSQNSDPTSVADHANVRSDVAMVIYENYMTSIREF